MSALSTKDLRQRIAGAVTTVAGWHETTKAPGAFPVMNSNQEVHKSFSVELGDTTPISGRQQSGELQVVETTVNVKCAYTIRPVDQVAAFDELLDEEQLVLQAIMSTTSRGSLHISYEQTTRILTNNIAVSTTTINARHSIQM